jgi:coniferyl-aldehyde dehydrogenase
MGSYHGEDGFKRFSHAKAIYTQTKLGAVLEALRPPYGDSILKMAKSQSK